jgi:hypothetical protein
MMQIYIRPERVRLFQGVPSFVIQIVLHMLEVSTPAPSSNATENGIAPLDNRLQFLVQSVNRSSRLGESSLDLG